MSKNKDGSEKFYSPTLGELGLPAVVGRIKEYMESEPEYKYCLIIGTDSAGRNHSGVDFVTALVVHRLGGGGIYFWKKKYAEIHSLRERIYHEAALSLEFAQELLVTLHGEEFLAYDFEIHVDMGKEGETKEMIAEVVGMIRGSGFNVRTKPESYGASSVADRYT